MIAVIAAGSAHAFFKLLPGTGSIAIGAPLVAVSATALGELATACVLWSPIYELEAWMTSFGIVQFALIAASGSVMAKDLNRSGSMETRVAPASGDAASAWRLSSTNDTLQPDSVQARP